MSKICPLPSPLTAAALLERAASNLRAGRVLDADDAAALEGASARLLSRS
jgi:hypothetical protein